MIQAPALAALLPKLHLNRHSPRAIVYAGPKYGGLQITDLYIDQGYGQLTLFIGHLKLADEIGAPILSVLSHLQLHIGSSHPVLTLPFSRYQKWIETNWRTSLWEFTSSLSIKLDVERQWLPQPSRQFDESIMDMAERFPISPAQKRQINLCHIYLQVISLSNITTANGGNLTPSVQEGVRDTSRFSSLSWPTSRHLLNWAPWNIFLNHISTGGKLHRPLGSWLAFCQQTWSHFYNPQTDIVYQKTGDQWLSFHPATATHRTRHSTHLYGQPPPCREVPNPSTLLVTAVTHRSNSLISSIPSPNIIPATSMTDPISMWCNIDTPSVFSDTPPFF
jgi:hypothetical protein